MIFKLELSLVNLLVSRIFVILCWLDSRTDVRPVDGIIGDGFRRSPTVEFELDFCGTRDLTWWLLSDKRNSLFIASGDCVPKENKDRYRFLFYLFIYLKKQTINSKRVNHKIYLNKLLNRLERSFEDYE